MVQLLNLIQLQEKLVLFIHHSVLMIIYLVVVNNVRGLILIKIFVYLHFRKG